MVKKNFFVVPALLLTSALAFPVLASEKVRMGLSVKVTPTYYLPVAAAEENGLWKENNLEVEVIPFAGGGPFIRAFAAGAIDIGLGTAGNQFQGAAAGVPTFIVASLMPTDEFILWVRTDSRFKEPKELKGARVGVGAFGGAQHIYGRAIVAGLGLEKEVKFVSGGGIPEVMAMLKTGAIDGVVQPLRIMIDFKLKGEVREFLSTRAFLSPEWSEHIVAAHRDFVRKKPDVVKKVIRAVVRANNFIRDNRPWAQEKMRATSGYSEEASRLVYDTLPFDREGKVNPKALENIKKFVIDFGIVQKEKALPVSEMYWESSP